MLGDCWLGFWQGVTRPSLTSLVITFSLNGLALAALYVLSVFITSDFLAGPRHRYLMESPFDRNVPIAAKVLSARYSEPPDIVVFGASLTVRCVTSEEHLSDLVAEKLGGPKPIVYDLTSDGLWLWHLLALEEQLGPRFEGLLIIGVGPGTFSHRIEEIAMEIANGRLGFRSRAFDSELRSAGLNVPYRTGNYFIDNWRFFLARRYFIARNVFITGPQSYGDPLDAPWLQRVNRPEFWQREIEKFPSRMQRYDTYKQANQSVIARVVAKLKMRGNASIILFQVPINPRWYDVPNGKEFFERYQNDLRHFATQHGMSFLSAAEEAAFLPADFVDYEGHIGTPEARERCTKAIAAHAAKVMAKKVALGLSGSSENHH